MGFKIYNYTPNKFRGMIKILRLFLPFAKDRLKFDRDPIVKLLDREQDKAEILGKTAFYDPDKMIVSVFTYGRHPKDIMRSIAHELVHHSQACRGDLGNESTPEGYAQNDPHLRKMEKEAYLQGNMCFRDFEDKYKQDPSAMRQKYRDLSISKQEENPMKPLNEWKNEEIFGMLMERFVPASKKRLAEQVEEEEEDEKTEESEADLDDKDLANNTPPKHKIIKRDVIAQAKHNASKKGKK
jgi:hypothetical protein